MSKELHDEIMNIACRREDASFLNQASRLLYKEGHRDARHDAAALALAAAPQVVADERAASGLLQKLLAVMENAAPVKASDWPAFEEAEKELRAALAAAPVQEQEPVISIGEVWPQEKRDEFLEVLGKYDNSAPVQPVAVPDGWRDKLVGLTVSMDVSTGDDDAFHRVFGEVEGVMPQGDSHVIMAVETSRNFAAPAAQGDAIRKVEIDDQGPLGVVTKTTYALANAKDAKDAERWRFARKLLITNDFPHNHLRCQSAEDTDSRIDAIAAKAAS